MTQRIAKYEIVEKIAEGGFGVVYRARDPFIKRQVAIKTCSVANEEMARRFFREAEIAGRFDHPNVTIVHDFGVEGQLAYLVQEYLSGEDLLAKIRRREALPIAEKIGWLLQVAAGLAYAHSKDVIHRDIKPANLRVLEDGSVKILDFGIAKLVSGATQLTQKGMAVGTLGYLSPEQLRDQELDTRTDIFSFGVVAYELVTYQKPFQSRHLSTLMEEILHREPPAMSALVPDCPPALEAVVRKCLAKNRAERYQSFEEVILALEGVRRTLPAAPEAAAVPRDPPPAPRVEPDESVTKPIPLAGVPHAAPPPPPPPRAPARPRSPAVPTPPVAAPPPGSALADAPAAPAPAAVLPSIEAATVEPLARTVVLRSPPVPPPSSVPPPPPPVGPVAAPAPEPEEALPVPAPAGSPRPAPPRTARILPWLAAAAVLAAALVLGVLWIVLQRRPAAPATPAAPVTVASPSGAAPPVASGRTGILVVAAPWAEVRTVRAAGGGDMPLPPERTTPVLIDLPPGRYTLTLAHPAASAPATCEAEVAEGKVATCRVEALQVEVMRYFKDAGWWG